jgi:hypothetical protein
MKLADYHALPVASNSRLRELKRSPAHLLSYLSTKQEDTDATRLGNAVHCVVLEPDDFDARYCVAGQCDAKKKSDGKRCENSGIYWHPSLGWACGVHGKDFPAENPRIVLKPDDYTACIGIRDSIGRLSTARQLLSGDGEMELTAVFPAFETDVLAKARFDRLSPVIGAAAVQLPAKHFVHIAIEKEPPYAVAVYRLTEGAIQAGEQELLPLLALYAECTESGVFPAYPDEVQDIALPNYAWSQIDDDLAHTKGI